MAYVLIYNYSGTNLNIEATATTCTNTYNGIQQVCTMAKNMPSKNHTQFNLTQAEQTGLQAQSVEQNGPTPLVFHPLETGSIIINEESGALEFKPGAPNGGQSTKFPGTKKAQP